MHKTFLFYDIETTGLNACFDQILQFAAIRTDEKLNELERHQFFIRLNSDVIPTPQALLTHQIPWKQIQAGEKELPTIKKIHELCNVPNTISAGYNTLNFDDEFLRFSFYRNLLPPYTHQYAQNCGRMDIYLMTIMYYLFKPQTLSWPKINNTLSLKLEHLNNFNHFASGTAHDAMVDVEMTLNLARRLYQDVAMWQYLRGYFDKNTDLNRTNKLVAINQQVLLIDSSLGTSNNYICPVLSLGQHYHYKNQTLWLRLDTPFITTTTKNNLTTTTYVMRKKFGESGFLLPAQSDYLKLANPERLELANNNLHWLQQNSAILKAISEYYCNYTYPKIPHLDVDAALYQLGFPSEHDQYLCAKFHTLNTEQKINFLDEFKNKNLRTQALRILGRNYYDALPQELQNEYLTYLKLIYTDQPTTICDFRNHLRFTRKNADDAIAELKPKTSNETQRQILEQLEKYLLQNPCNQPEGI